MTADSTRPAHNEDTAIVPEGLEPIQTESGDLKPAHSLCQSVQKHELPETHVSLSRRIERSADRSETEATAISEAPHSVLPPYFFERTEKEGQVPLVERPRAALRPAEAPRRPLFSIERWDGKAIFALWSSD